MNIGIVLYKKLKKEFEEFILKPNNEVQELFKQQTA